MGTVVISGNTYYIYGEHTAATTYLTGSFTLADSWIAMTSDKQKAALVEAARALDLLSIKGEKQSPSQPLAWPRDGATDGDGDTVTTVPDDWVTASYLLAGHFAAGFRAPGAPGAAPGSLRSMTIGRDSVSFFRGDTNPVGTVTNGLPADVSKLVSQYLGTAAGSDFGDLLVPFVSGTDGESEFDTVDRYPVDEGFS